MTRPPFIAALAFALGAVFLTPAAARAQADRLCAMIRDFSTSGSAPYPP